MNLRYKIILSNNNFYKEIGVGDGYSFIGGKVNKIKTILNK